MRISEKDLPIFDPGSSDMKSPHTWDYAVQEGAPVPLRDMATMAISVLQPRIDSVKASWSL